MSDHQALGGRIVTKPFMVLLAIFMVGCFFMVERFTSGIGAVSNLNGGFSWGLWIVLEVVIGTAFACGGFALAFMVYVFNKGQYHPLVRPAVMASLLGYALGGFGAFFDMGRFWQFYEIFIPGNWNLNSVMLEVGLCITIYIFILALEFAPALLEKLGMRGLLKSLNKVAFFLIALGVLLPLMHQSSLGSLLIALGHKVHPLWQTQHMQPLLALLSALIMGFSIVIFEASTSSLGFGLKSESSLLAKMSKTIVGLLVAFLAIRFIVLMVQGNFGLIFDGDFASLMFLLETVLFVIPIIILLSPDRSSRGSQLLIAAMSMLIAGSLYRFDAFLVTFNPGPGYSYFPSTPEIMISLGIVAFEIMAYLVLVKTLPVLHREARV